MGRLTEKASIGAYEYYTAKNSNTWRCVQKLAHYEDLEEAGRLIEVVRCKDCGVWRVREDGLINCPYCLDLKNDDDFCSYGELSEEAEAKLKELEGDKE